MSTQDKTPTEYALSLTSPCGYSFVLRAVDAETFAFQVYCAGEFVAEGEQAALPAGKTGQYSFDVFDPYFRCLTAGEQHAVIHWVSGLQQHAIGGISTAATGTEIRLDSSGERV